MEKLRDKLRITGLKEGVSLTKYEQALEKIGVLELEVANVGGGRQVMQRMRMFLVCCFV